MEKVLGRSPPSLLKLTKDVIKGKYDDFSTLSTTSELIVVVKSSDLIEFEKLPVFEFVRRKHPHLAKEKVESDVMIQVISLRSLVHGLYHNV